MFAAIDPRRRAAGTPFENVAEEVLNGLFCHYEPPTSEYAQHKAATKAKMFPEKYNFSQVKKTQSILRTSRLFRKRQAVVEARKKKAVTWRDEKSRIGIESTVESCAVRSCGFLGLSRAGDEGLADSLSPTKAHSDSKETKNPIPEPILKPIPTSREPLKDGLPKKVLYDDEGNPISDENSVVGDENKNPIQGTIPPAPTGLTQLRKMAKDLGEDVYEPDDYDQPVSKKVLVRSGTPRHSAGGDDKNALMRSLSPPSSTLPNHYDTPEQFEKKQNAYRRISSRPGTPIRCRGTESEENSILDGVQKESDIISPSRRSDVFSDLTMDEALSGRNSYRYPASPAKTSEGIEVDMVKGRARPRSRSPSRYRDETSAGKKSSVYDDMGNVERRSGDEGISGIPRKSSYDDKKDKRRRHSMNAPPVVEGTIETIKPRKESRSRRISEPLPVIPLSRLEDDGFQQLNKVASRSAIPVVETGPSLQEDDAADLRRDPTPRMSSESAERGDENELARGPLPPTPRQKDGDRRSSHGTRDKDPTHRLQRSIREGLQYDDERRTRISLSREARITAGEGYDTYPSDAPRPKSTTNGHAAPSMYDWKYKTNPLSPTTVATDDEIRAEVSSVGMESNTLRPFANYHNPFIKEHPQPATINEESALRTSDDADASTLSHSTGSSHEKQPHKKAKSRKEALTEPVKPMPRGEAPIEPVKTSSGSGSTRTKKLWKGWKKAVGKVKQIVKDIDDQRIPNPELSAYALQPTHPTLGR